jgi:site-specific DNA recombinase
VMRSPVGPLRARPWRCLSEHIARDSFAPKHTELQDRLASIKLQLDPAVRSRYETAELAVRVFELLQTIRQQWLTAD